MVFRKVFCKSNGAVEVFVCYFIGNVCVNTLCRSASECQCFEPLKAAAAAVCAMGLAGEIGWSHMKPEDGNSTYRNRIIDAIYHMDGETLEKGAKYEVR